MKLCLVDVNVMLALLVRQHEHHRLSRKWFDTLEVNEAGLCRLVHLALIRLLGNSAIMGDDALSASAAWILVEELLVDERVDFLAEPSDLDSVMPTLLHYPIPTGKLVGDAYLAAFAMCEGRRVATLDRGFRQFRGLSVELLGR
jgi:toxin-antitoxin system PIN domain toxin